MQHLVYNTARANFAWQHLPNVMRTPVKIEHSQNSHPYVTRLAYASSLCMTKSKCPTPWALQIAHWIEKHRGNEEKRGVHWNGWGIGKGALRTLRACGCTHMCFGSQKCVGQAGYGKKRIALEGMRRQMCGSANVLASGSRGCWAGNPAGTPPQCWLAPS